MEGRVSRVDDDHYILWLYFVLYTVCGVLQL